MSTNARRRQPKSPALPIDLEEIEQDPGFRGMLSFLEVSPEDRAALLAQRAEAERHSPMGDTPAPEKPVAVEQSPMERTPKGSSSDGDSSMGDLPVVQPLADDRPTGQPPLGLSPMGAIPYMDVEGRGKRPLRYCQTVQDGHTAAEHLAYQALWAYARKHGQAEATGSSVVDVGLSQICLLLASDHKNVKRLLGSLEAKLAIEVVRKPDYRLATPTRYRIFHSTQILNRRREAGLLWVVRTRAVRFVDLPTVQRILGEQSMGELPMDEPLRAPGFPATLSRVLNQWTVEDGAVRQLWDACRRNSSDCTEDEVLWFCRAKEPLLRSGQIDDPAGLLLRTIPRFFANGGGAALEAFRREREREQERDRRRERQVALAVLDDPQSTEAELAWAREIMAAEQGSGRPAS